MRYFLNFGAALLAVLCLRANQQSTPAQEEPKQDQAASATKGMPARATPNDYQAHGQAGKVTIGAEFFQHGVPTPEGLLSTEDFVTVEVGVFGPPGARTPLSFQDFSLRINGKKNPHSSEYYETIFKSLKDPEWEPPVPAGEDPKTSKTAINSGGALGNKGGLGGGEPPPVVHPPAKLQREWEQRVKKEIFPEGNHPLPQAGLLFFRYGGRPSGIHSLELIYSGPDGKVTLALHP
jgi:hypothetical protein